MHSALAQINLLILSYLFIIQFSYFLVDDLLSRYGQQLVCLLSLLCNCWQGTELRLGTMSWYMSRPSTAARRQVILGYKCVHEGCQKSFEPRKGYNVYRERNRGKPCGEFSSGAKSFRAARKMLNAQSFIYSPLSTWRIKVRIARICENRSCEQQRKLR